MMLYAEDAAVQRKVTLVFVQAVTGDLYKSPPLVVSCAPILIGIRPKECWIVKSVFAAPGVVPDAFQAFMFWSLSALLIVDP